MQISRNEYSRRPFVLTPQDLSALMNILGRLGDVTSSIDCSDGLTRKFETIESLLQYDNLPSQQIRELSMSSRGKDLTAWASVSLANQPFSNFRLHLEGPEEVIAGINHDLEARLSGMNPWYAVVTRGEVFLFTFGLLIVTFVIVLG